jgi:hypothetical protein
MQPTEQTPSPDVQQPDAEAADAESSAPSGEPPSWWQRLLGRRGREEDQAEEEKPPEPAASKTRTLTEEEFQRAIQAETDRREAKRQREADIAARRKLRDEDPWAYAEQERQAEQKTETDGQLNSVFQGIGQAHDAVTLDPLMQRLPAEEQQRILGLENAGVGLDGRKLITEQALASLEKHWKAEGAKEAEQKLRRNTAFRKQVFAELRGTAPEPEVLPSGAAREPERGDAVNDMLRQQLGLPTRQ